jgi:uncharacterized integral membrane protein (TIGR00698 family)
LFDYLDSLEGVPDMFEPRVRVETRPAWHRGAYDALTWAGNMTPGVGLALGIAWVGYFLSEAVGHGMHFGKGKSPISPITMAVVVGLVIRNVIGVPGPYEAGLRFCIKTVLRLGIVVLGLTLSVKAIGRDVVVGLPVVVACIATALVVITYLTRALGLSRRLGTLIAVGTSVCGVSAIVATAPIIDAEDDETSYAVACITLFGLVALLAYPFVAHSVFATPGQAGTFLGTAIHDTSQVAGAGLAYAQQYGEKSAMDTAVTVKLVRNLSMAVLIPLMAILYRRGEGTTKRAAWHQVVPLFVIGFVVMACVRSLGDAGDVHGKAFGMVDRANWNGVGAFAKGIVPWMLAVAMAAVGLGTGLAKLRGLGLKPLTVGFAAAAVVGGVSMTLVKVLAAYMH